MTTVYSNETQEVSLRLFRLLLIAKSISELYSALQRISFVSEQAGTNVWQKSQLGSTLEN
jgi:hypothetical protein